MTRIAHCCCGALRAETTGEPAFVAACHCMECQRRTGSPFGVSTYFPKAQVRVEGPSQVYVRGSDAGRKIELHFCPNCGSTVFWYAELAADFIGVALGAFADPSMPWPTLSVWETTRHPWVTFGHGLGHFVRQYVPIEDPGTAPGERPHRPDANIPAASRERRFDPDGSARPLSPAGQ